MLDLLSLIVTKGRVIPKRPRLLVVGGVLLAVVLVAIVLVVRHGPDPEPPGQVVLGAAPVSCRDVLLVGVDGGGERPGKGRVFGPTVEEFRVAYSALAAKGQRTVDVRRVTVKADPPRRLLPKRTSPTANARKALAASKERVRAWRAPVPHAVARVAKVLAQGAGACPEQQVVLVGFSHGASTVHRVLDRVAASPIGLGRVAGAVLISDPDRVSKTSAALAGAPPAPRSGAGVFARILRPQGDTPAPTATTVIWQVCSRGDLVCAPRGNTVKQALRVARGYHQGPGARAVRRVARAAWASTALVPLPTPRTQAISMRVGKPFSAQLAVRVKSGLGPTVIWSPSTALPPGLTLSPGGLLSGVPTLAGAYGVDYQVSGSQPPTAPTTGSLAITITTGAVSTAVSAGGQSSCAIHNDGTLWCWGRNNFGQLGDGTMLPRPTPVQAGTLTDWRQVSTSGATTCAIRADSSLWCWGLSNFGQLGRGKTSPVTTPTQVGTNRTWTSVSTSWFHTCATRANGTLWCWGANKHGELGLGSVGPARTSPQKVGTLATWTSVTSGGFHSCATRSDGTAWCWGQNIFGQLGNADVAIQPAPVQVGTLTDWARLSASWAHTCGVTTTGEGRCWGFNGSGQIGDGTLTTRRAPVTVAGAHSWTSISTAESSSCAVDATGGAWCWGANRYGQLGTGQTATSLVPVPMPGSPVWAALSAGWWHGCGLRQDGETFCWGNNEWGQLGDASLANSGLPKEVP